MTRELTAGDFPQFVVEATGHAPYSWQRRLADEVIATGKWPDSVRIFTGGGKSIIPLIHVFVCALRPDYGPRMVHVVPLRTLVDAQHQRMEQVAEMLRDAADRGDDSVLGAVASKLRARRLDESGDPLITVYRRGAMEDARSREWVVDPAACTTITMTRDMALSALLFQGYGTTRHARPVEAGLLGHGTVMVLDEAHTARQATFTARSVRELIERTGGEIPAGALQVVESTATPAPEAPEYPRSEITWGVEDERELAAVMHAHKPLTLHTEALDDRQIAELALNLHREVGRGSGRPVTGPVAVIRNTVGGALEVATKLAAADETLRVVCLTGRMRTYDRDLHIDPANFTPEGDPNTDVIVATQVIEVGVDADWSAMVTDLAPASTIAQRAGRVNRRGVYHAAHIHVLMELATELPYETSDLAASEEWLSALSASDSASLDVAAIWGEGMPPVPTPELVRSWFTPKVSPKRSLPEFLSAYPKLDPDHTGPAPDPWKWHPGTKSYVAPITLPCRVLHRVELTDAWHWSESTSRARFADDDLRIWISDDLSSETEARIAVRFEPTDLLDSDRADLLEALPLEPQELWNVDIKHARDILESLLAKGMRDFSSISLIDSGGEVRDLDTTDLSAADDLYPGCTVVLWTHQPAVGLTQRWTLDGPRFESRKVPTGEDAETVHVPLEELRRSPKMILGAGTLNELSGTGDGGDDTKAEAELRELCGVSPGTRVKLSREVDGKRRWAIVYTRVGNLLDEDTAQAWTPAAEPVTLAAHSADVAAECVRLAEKVGLGEELAQALMLAGRHHDAGKADMRYQRDRLGNLDEDVILAKSGKDSGKIKFLSRSAGRLPYRWRHEQLSAALAFGIEADHPERELIALLCGLTHGHGRSAFPHRFTTLTGGAHPDATDLFTDGMWEDMLHRAALRFGTWGLAWLEALVRAADNNISSQGR